MGPRIRFLAELIHDVYGLPLEPIQDAAVTTSKGFDIEKTAKYKVKEPEVKKIPDMDDPLLSQDCRHVGARFSVLESKDCDLQEEPEEAEVDVEEDVSRGRGAENTGRETNPISHLKQQSGVDFNVECVETTESTFVAVEDDCKERETTKKGDEATEVSRNLEDPLEVHPSQEMRFTKPGVEAKEMAEIMQPSDEERSGSELGGDADCVKSHVNVVSRARMRSLVSSGEEDCKLKVSCQMEGEVEIVDADNLLTSSSRRTRVQVKDVQICVLYL